MALPSLNRTDQDLAADDRAIGPRLFEILRSEIISTRLMPGQGISEKEIAARFGVSRQPVREAFIKLSEVGLLQIVPSRGSFVSRISIRHVLSARFVREAVECALVRVAARIATRDQCRMLQATIEAQLAAMARGDELMFNHLDERSTGRSPPLRIANTPRRSSSTPAPAPTASAGSRCPNRFPASFWWGNMPRSASESPLEIPTEPPTP